MIYVSNGLMKIDFVSTTFRTVTHSHVFSSNNNFQQIVESFGKTKFSFLSTTSELAQLVHIYPQIPMALTQGMSVMKLAGKVTKEELLKVRYVFVGVCVCMYVFLIIYSRKKSSSTSQKQVKLILNYGYGGRITRKTAILLNLEDVLSQEMDNLSPSSLSNSPESTSTPSTPTFYFTSTSSSIIARFWAAKKLEALQSLPCSKKVKREITELGRKYRCGDILH